MLTTIATTIWNGRCCGWPTRKRVWTSKSGTFISQSYHNTSNNSHKTNMYSMIKMILHKWICMYTYIYIYIYIEWDMCICMCVCMYVCMYACMYVCMCIYIYIYICVYIYIYIYTCICMRRAGRRPVGGRRRRKRSRMIVWILVHTITSTISNI